MSVFSINDRGIDPQNNRVFLIEESSSILQRLKKINSDYFFKPDQDLVHKLSLVDPVDLNKVLHCLFKEMLEEDQIKDPIKFLDRLSMLIPLAKLEESVTCEVENVLKEARGMFEEARLYLENTKGTFSLSSYMSISSTLDGIISAIESIINAFGIRDFFKPAENDSRAQFKAQKIMMLLHLFSVITAITLPVCGASAGGAIIGGTLLVIAALSVIWPFIKPKATYLPGHAENWTKEVLRGDFVAQGRKESLDEIANVLKMNRHPILVGPSRVGKSLTAKAFAQAVGRGDYPELKGKVVFRINTTDILEKKASVSGGGSNILNEISEAMGRHRNDIILVLDEIHMACKNNEKTSDQLKTFLDEGGQFPHVIGITTEEEYGKYVKDNQAFSLRFDRIDIQNTSRDETLKILSDTLLRSRFQPIIQEGILDLIYDESSKIKDSPQPATSLKLLKQCINQTGKTQRSPTEKKILEVSNQILSLSSQSAATRGKKKDTKVQIVELEKQRRDLQAELGKEKKKLNQLCEARNLLDRVTQEMYSSSLKISANEEKAMNTKSEKHVKLFILLREFFVRSLESYIQEKAKELGIKVEIDEALIHEMTVRYI